MINFELIIGLLKITYNIFSSIRRQYSRSAMFELIVIDADGTQLPLHLHWQNLQV